MDQITFSAAEEKNMPESGAGAKAGPGFVLLLRPSAASKSHQLLRPFCVAERLGAGAAEAPQDSVCGKGALHGGPKELGLGGWQESSSGRGKAHHADLDFVEPLYLGLEGRVSFFLCFYCCPKEKCKINSGGIQTI